MAPKKRLTRKQLLKEPDEFITITGQCIRWARRYQLQLTIGFTVFFLLLIAVAGMRYFADRAEDQAFVRLDQALKQYEARLDDVGPEAALQDVSETFAALVKKYGNRAGGRLARVVYAEICYRGGQAGQAVRLYEAALRDMGKDALYRELLLSSLGYAYERQNDLQKAVQQFEKVVQNEGTLVRDVALFNLGRLYEELGDRDKSRQAFQEIVSEHADSMYFELAKEKVAG